MSDFIVVAYYTIDTLYEARARILQKSLARFDIPYHIEGVANLGTWLKNTSYKPTFVKKMLQDFDEHIVYVDADAEFQRYPELFDTLGDSMEHDVAAYVFDRSCYNRSSHGFELLSGTVFFKNTDTTKRLVKEWEERCQRQAGEWDQKSLEYVLKERFDPLPGEYCKIFDRQNEITDPVIVHYQASRIVRRNRGQLNTTGQA
jgi:hypothetical protein